MEVIHHAVMLCVNHFFAAAKYFLKFLYPAYLV